jgi:hypothetical protein
MNLDKNKHCAIYGNYGNDVVWGKGIGPFVRSDCEEIKTRL